MKIYSLLNNLLCLKSLFLIIIITPISLNAQQSLWVGQSYTFDVSSSVVGLTANMSWSTNGGYLSLSGSGFYRTITITQYFSGTATVTCEWDYKLTSNGTYTHTRRDVTITCKDNQVSITPTALVLNIGETSSVGCFHQYDNQYINAANTYFQSNNPNVVTVDENTGEIYAKSPGTAYINVYSKISSVSPYCRVTVNQLQPTSISIPNFLSLVAGTTHQITVALKPNDAVSTLTWYSDDTEVAIVSQSGVISAVNPGTTTIKVKTANGLTATCTLSVSEPPINLKSSLPLNNSSNTSVTEDIMAYFTCDIFEGVNFSDIKLIDTDNNIVKGTINMSNNTLSFNPNLSLSPLTLYTLLIPKGALNNRWGTTNIDSIVIMFKTGQKEKLSLSTNKKSGIVDSGTEVSLISGNNDAKIYYTIDNSDPYQNGLLYEAPLRINKTQTIRAYATLDGYIDSDVVNATYIIATGNSTTSDTYLSLDNMLITSKEVNLLDISLVNPNQNITFVQFDIYFPNYISLYDNMILQNVLTNRIPVNDCLIEMEPQEDGSIRIIIASYSNQPIKENLGAILQLPIVANEGVYEDLSYLNNILLVSPKETVMTPSTNYATISVNNTTCIKEISENKELVITNKDGVLTLLSLKNIAVNIYKINSQLVTRINLSAGVSKSIALPKGVYLINNKKIIL